MLINGQPADQVSALDRGLAYGDGIYRTVELKHGQPRLWRWQYARLRDDAARLNLPLPDETVLLDELMQLGRELPWAVGKITLTRGTGARGYAMPVAPNTTRIVAVTPWQGYPAAWGEQGVAVRWCSTQLACQPLLAGIKHLNRLENVLARSEWNDAAIQEGLLRDTQGRLVEGTMSNVYLLRGNVILTPRLDQAGVNGAVRDWLRETAPSLGLVFIETELWPADLEQADAVFLSNSLIGIWPLARLDARLWTPNAKVAGLRSAWQAQA